MLWLGKARVIAANERTGLNEAFSGFENIGHNSLWDLTFLWIIPK
jgi:hypothetical protein